MRIKNWSKFQHFKDRRPPWIKLYRDILDDLDWHELSGDDAKMLVMLWLIGSEDEGRLPDSKTIAFRLRMSVKDVEKSISKLEHWLISERYQDDINLSQKNSVAEQFDSVADIETPLRDRDRGEKETEKEGSAEPQSDSTPSGILIPLANGSDFDVPTENINEWRMAYPAVDVEQQLRQMRAWCISNPSNRKTQRGITAFINRWLAKEQDKPSYRMNGARNPAFGNGVAL